MHSVDGRVRKQSDLVRLLPARNLYHGVRLASSLDLPLNLFVSLGFSRSACPTNKTDRAFAAIRNQFGKWITRPRKEQRGHLAPPTFVWVIENPNGCSHAHWLVHIPIARQREFRVLLAEWFAKATGGGVPTHAIHIKKAKFPKGTGKYMLKGMHPALARRYDILHENQGWVTGRRIGHSKNIGPVQVAEMFRQGRYLPPSRWKWNKYGQHSG